MAKRQHLLKYFQLGIICLLLVNVAPAMAFNLPAAAGSTIELLIFSQVQSTGPGTAQDVTITNTGGSDLVVNSITLSGADAAEYQFQSAPVVPVVIPAGNTVSVASVEFVSSSSGVKVAQVEIQTAPPDNATYYVALRGLATYGIGGSSEPSMAWIMETFNLMTDVGDDNPADIWIDSVDGGAPLVGPDEVAVEVFQAANPANPVTLQVLASYGGNVNPVSRVGWYPVGNASSSTQLFTIPQSDAQTLNPTISGVTSFTPGAATFGFYSQWPAFSDRLVYTENAYNTVWAGLQNNKMRVFLHRDANGVVVPNSYIITTEEFTSPPEQHDYNDVVFIVSNVQPGTTISGGTIRFENRDWQTLNSLAVPGMEYLNTWLTFNQISDRTPGWSTNTSWRWGRVHEQVALRIHNDNPSETLNITSFTISDPSLFGITNGETALSIGPGGYYDQHVYFERLCGGKGVRNATLTIQSSDVARPSQTINLSGVCMTAPEGFNEVNVTEVGLAFGVTTDFGIPIGQFSPAQGSWSALGEEILTPDWQAVDPSQPIYIRQIAAFHFCCGPRTRTRLDFVMGADLEMFHHRREGQSLLPIDISGPDTVVDGDDVSQKIAPNDGPATELVISRTERFKFVIDGREACYTTCADGHGVRVWPLRDPNGNLVPGSYIVGMDYVGGGSSTNFDYNDNMYLITNLQPLLPTDLAISMTDTPDPVAINSSVLYTVNIDNNSVTDADNTTVEITIPNTLVVNSTVPSAGSCSTAGQIVTCNMGTLGAGNSATVVVNTTTTTAGNFVAAASVTTSTPEALLDDNDATEPLLVSLPGAHILVEKSPSSQEIEVGQDANFSIVVRNNGTEALSSVTVSDPLCTTGPTYLNGDGGVAGVLDLFEVWTYTCQVENVSSAFTNTVTVSGQSGGGTIATDSDSASVLVNPSSTACPPLYRINAGTTTLSDPTDAGAMPWSPDAAYVVGGRISSPSAYPITRDPGLPATVPTGLFVVERWDPTDAPEMQYSFPVPAAGQYILRLYFAETFRTWTGDWFSGGRVFDVNLEGVTILDDFDVYDVAGSVDYAFVETFYPFITDGVINIEFIHQVENPIIKGIEIIPTTCGNTPPITEDDSATTDEDVTVIIDILANDSDPDRDALVAGSIVIIDTPLHGSISGIDGTTGEVTYVPDGNFFGADSFTYTVRDSNNASSATATVNITINPLNDAPVAQDNNYSMNEGETLTVTVPGILNNDTDVENDTLQTTVITNPTGAAAFNLALDGSFTYEPATGTTGDSFEYQIDDGNGGFDTATVIITVAIGPNNDPVATDDSYSVSQGQTLTVPAPGVLANDTDADGHLLTATLITPPTGASIFTLDASGLFVYRPATGVTSDSFTYEVNDGNGGVDTATVTLSVNQPPVAVSDTTSTTVNTPVTFAVLTNDSDPDGDALDLSSVVAVTSSLQPGHSVVVNGTTGEITYTPANAFVGIVAFEYQMRDVNGALSNPAIVNVLVNPVSGTCVPLYRVNVGGPAVAPPNGFGPIWEEDRKSSGRIGGTATYGTPSPYIVNSDSSNASGTATAITLPPTMPASIPASVFQTERWNPNPNPTMRWEFPVVPGNYEVRLYFTETFATSVGQRQFNVSVEGTQLITNADIYSDAGGRFIGVMKAVNTVSDATLEVEFIHGLAENSMVAGIEILQNVCLPNNPPNANDDSATLNQGESVVIPILANDSDVDSQPLNPMSIVLNTASFPAGHTATVNPVNGDVTYTPPADYYGSLTFTYTVKDAMGAASAPATVSLTVNGAPQTVDDNFFTRIDVPFTFFVLANDSDPEADTLDISTLTFITLPSNGTYIFNSTTGAVDYTPTAGFSGSDTMTYTVRDSKGAISRETTVLIAVNDVPVARDDMYVVVEDTPINIAAPGIMNNDSGEPSLTLTPVLDTDVTSGTLTLNTDGSFSYVPVQDFNGVDSFTYHVNDGTLDSAIVTVTLNVGGTNDLPVATTDLYSTNEDTTLNVPVPGVLVNDTDIDGDALTVVLDTDVSNGTLTLNADGSFVYAPNLNFNGVDSFTYHANDGTGDSNTVTVTLAVNPQPDNPVANDDSYSTDEDTTLTINAPGILANDTDIENDALSAVLDSTTTNGTLVLNNSGSFVYTPNANFNGVDSFTYHANDGAGDSNIATVTITVNPLQDAPVSVGDAYSTVENTTLNIAAPGVLGNDSDVDSPALTAVLDTTVSNGALTLNADGSFTYTPTGGFVGTDSFSYRANDGALSGNLTSVILTVTDANDAPVATADSYTTAEDTPLNVPAAGVLTNDTDADGDVLSAILDTNVSNGTLALNANGSFAYTPNANFNGADSFTYHAFDGALSSTIVTVTITVNPQPDVPIAVADNYATNEDTPLNVPAMGVLTNDSDVDGNALTAVLDTTVSNGTLTLNADGSFSYTPALNFNGVDSFSYYANDGTLNSAAITVTITVNPQPDNPIAAPDTYNTSPDTTLTITAPGVIGNDTNVDGGALTSVLDTTVSNGALTLNPDGSFVYTPTIGFNGSDSFTYHVNNGAVDSNVVTVTINISAVNNPPVAPATAAYGLNEDETLTVVIPGLLTGITDADGDSLIAVLDSTTTNGTLVLNSNGSFTYTPNPDFNGTDTFTYHASDGSLNSGIVTVTLTISPVNDRPVAQADGYSTDENTTLTIPAAGVLGNDSDVDNPTLTAVLNSTVSNGTLTLNADGSFTYTPTAGYSGTDSFTYTASDGSLSSNAVTVTLTVNNVNEMPLAADNTYSTDEGTTLTVAVPGVLNNDSDPDSDPITAILDTNVSNGTLILNANGSFTYTPNAGFIGVDSFTYYVNDGVLNSTSATVTITVLDVLNPPVATGETYSIVSEQPLTVPAPGVLGNDTDVDGDSLTAVLDSTTINGTLTLNADGSFTYTSNAGYSGVDSFRYHTNDGSLNSNAVTVTINVTPANQAPIATANSYTTDQGTSLTVPAPGILNDDSDPDSDPITAVLDTDVANGILVLNPDGSFTYTPNTGFFGTDKFTYHVNDGSLDSNVVAVTLMVNAVIPNQPPVAIANGYTLTTGITMSLPAPGILSNDSDPDGDIITAILDTNVLNGTLNLNPGGSFTYTPNSGFIGVDSFTYHANDGALNSSIVTVTLNVRSVTSLNQAPTAVANSYTVISGLSLILPAPGILDNDSDPDGDSIMAILDTNVTNGTLTLGQSGNISYTPNTGFVGTDSFTYHANDGSLNSNVVTVTIRVNAPVSTNRAPAANGDTYTMNAGTTLNINPTGVLGNDNDPDGNPITAVLEANVTDGTLNFNANGSFTYTPNNGFTGFDSFRYHATDGSLRSNAVTVGITVNAATNTDTTDTDNTDPENTNPGNTNSGNPITRLPIPGVDRVTIPSNNTDGGTTGISPYPTGYPDVYDLNQNELLQVNTNGLLTNDSDPNNRSLRVLLNRDVSNGTLTLNEDGTFSYMPDPDFVGIDRFSYVIDNGAYESAPVPVSLNVFAGRSVSRPVIVEADIGGAEDVAAPATPNRLPAAVGDAYETPLNTTLTLSAPGIMTNDSDPDGDSIMAVLVSTTQHGILVFIENGSFGYSPNTGFIGEDSFTYAVTDGEFTSNVVTVRINVTGENTVPTAESDTVSTTAGQPLVIDPLANDRDDEGSTLQMIDVEVINGLAAAVTTDGQTINFVPDADFIGTVELQYTITDITGLTGTGIITVEVTADPDNEESVEVEVEEVIEVASAGIFDPTITKIGLVTDVAGDGAAPDKQIEWLVTVTNDGDIPGNALQIVDEINPALRVAEVRIVRGEMFETIAGQTVTVIVPVLQPGENIQFAIITTLIATTESSISNTVTLTSGDMDTDLSADAQVVGLLPAAGAAPAELPVFVPICGLLSLLGLLALVVLWRLFSNRAGAS